MRVRVRVRGLWKKIITALSNKTNELRIRIMIFFLLHKNIDKTSLTQSLHALVSQPPSSSSHRPRHQNHHHDENKLEDVVGDEATITSSYDEYEGLSLTHELFKESEAEVETEAIMVHGGGAVEGTVEVGDEDIDQAADLFIQRFKKQMQLQKQLSLERNQNLLVSNA
ncbi:uncharacterized protein LOC141595730 [Silene latifolia]|uniref:uncharacterized protein LOC141595730 n=1 Tax=Silene latifolia TaxID=37657 RepID=UPI003D771E54